MQMLRIDRAVTAFSCAKNGNCDCGNSEKLPRGMSSFAGRLGQVPVPSFRSRGAHSGRRAAPLSVRAGQCPFGFTATDFPFNGATGAFHDENAKTSTSEMKMPITASSHLHPKPALGSISGATSTATDFSTENMYTPYSPAPSALSDEPDEIEYWPQKDQMPYRMITGLRLLRPIDDWLEIDGFYDEEMAMRRKILETRKPVVLGEIDLPRVEKTEAANWELLREISFFLTARHPERFYWQGPVLCNRSTGETFDLTDRDLDTLDAVSRLVQEDICLLLEDEKGTYRMISGAVLFPWRWWMKEKLGLSLRAIHGPVPLYQKTVASPVDSFFKNLKTEQPAWRVGWSVTNNPALYQATNEDEDVGKDLTLERPKFDEPITVEEAGTKIFYRVERQTFVRLPKTRAVVFTIRTYVKPLSFLQNRPELAANFLKALSTMDPRVAKYRGITGFHATAVQYVEKCAKGELLCNWEATVLWGSL